MDNGETPSHLDPHLTHQTPPHHETTNKSQWTIVGLRHQITTGDEAEEGGLHKCDQSKLVNQGPLVAETPVMPASNADK